MMNQKQRTLSLLFGVLLAAAGFGCIVAAGAVRDSLGRFAGDLFVVLGFALWIVSVIFLIWKFPRMASSEMAEEAAAMEADPCFFERIPLPEDAASLAEKLRRAGFRQKAQGLYKRRFSFLKDYINYYVFIESDVDIRHSVDSFAQRMDAQLETKKLFCKNNSVFLVFFQREIPEDDLNALKRLLIIQDVIQGLPRAAADTIIPIVYDVMAGEYIVRKSRKKHSLKSIHLAMNTFYEIVLDAEKPA